SVLLFHSVEINLEDLSHIVRALHHPKPHFHPASCPLLAAVHAWRRFLTYTAQADSRQVFRVESHRTIPHVQCQHHLRTVRAIDRADGPVDPNPRRWPQPPARFLGTRQDGDVWPGLRGNARMADRRALATLGIFLVLLRPFLFFLHSLQHRVCRPHVLRRTCHGLKLLSQGASL